MEKAVSRQSPRPLHAQVADALRKRILDGEYAPHEKLPSESELTRMFGVSRITVRNALQKLHVEGLVFSAQGKGTYVSMPKAVQRVERLEGFEEAMSATGQEASARLISIEECWPDEAVQRALQLPDAEAAVVVKRIRYLNREPVSLDVSYFPMDIGRQLFSRDLERDIFTLLENELGIPLGAADLQLEATSADPEIADLLSLRAGEPVLRVERLVFDSENRPVDFEYLFFCGSRYQFAFRVNRQ